MQSSNGIIRLWFPSITQLAVESVSIMLRLHMIVSSRPHSLSMGISKMATAAPRRLSGRLCLIDLIGSHIHPWTNHHDREMVCDILIGLGVGQPSILGSGSPIKPHGQRRERGKRRSSKQCQDLQRSSCCSNYYVITVVTIIKLYRPR